VRADEAVDPAFPSLHGRPRRGWVNDPNGLSFVDGRYHVFFQYNPDSARHAAIQWGHASSADLVHWQQEPVALTTRPGELDEYGCWSGCVVDDGGVPTALYSGVLDDDGRSSVLVARSDRTLRVWQQDHAPAAGMPDDPAITDLRDPFVFEFEGSRYGLLGAGHRGGEPQVLLYSCDDLSSWTLLGPLLTADDPVAATLTPANTWECPNLVPLDGRWVLIVSLWRQVDGEVVLDQVRYLLGDLSMGDGGPVFRPGSTGRLDTGPCFYAPQILVRPGRALLWAWAREHGRSEAAIDASGWAGTLTFPRELFLVGDVVASRPATELTALRGEPLEVRPGQSFAAASFELQAEAGAPAMTLHLVDGTREETVVWEPSTDPLSRPRILVDGSMVEVFDGGPTAHTTRAYPTASPPRWLLRGPAGSPAVRGWHLGR
jgi:beta-fructofuranosidase